MAIATTASPNIVELSGLGPAEYNRPMPTPMTPSAKVNQPVLYTKKAPIINGKMAKPYIHFLTIASDSRLIPIVLIF